MGEENSRNRAILVIKNLKIFVIVVCAFSYNLHAQTLALNPSSITHPVLATNGMVASQHYLASKVGEDILSKGGNAYDAAVAVGLAPVELGLATNSKGGLEPFWSTTQFQLVPMPAASKSTESCEKPEKLMTAINKKVIFFMCD